MKEPQVGAAFAVCLALTVAGCCSSGGGEKSCKAEVQFTAGNFSTSKPFVGKGGGDSKEAAQTNACWEYCFEGDPAFDGVYQIWRSGSEGSAYQKAGKQMTKKRIIIDDNTSLEGPFAQCVERCKGDAAALRNGLKFGPATCS